MKEDPRPYGEHITADPRILAEKPVVRGTRISVGLVLEEFAQNPNIDELLAAHPVRGAKPRARRCSMRLQSK
jgi:uncharacterized protein (DUF433 family)